mgnify:CR=1 FL=1
MNGGLLVVGERPKVPATTGPSEHAGPRSKRASTMLPNDGLEQYSAEMTCSCLIDEMKKKGKKKIKHQKNATETTLHTS